MVGFTPLKFNLEPENGPLEKEMPIKNQSFSDSMFVNLWGCNQNYC